MRPYCPGAAFHLMARTNGGDPLFVESIRDDIVQLICRHVGVNGTRLLAFTVLDNELDVILIQGRVSLGDVMKPLLQRVAKLTQRTHQCSGYLFNGRFKSRVCADARKAILWTHWLPVHAGFCRRVDTYRWSSHHAYAGVPSAPLAAIDVISGLELFAQRDASADLRKAYRAQIRQRIERDDFPAIELRRHPEDLPRELNAALKVIAPDCDLDLVRTPIFRSREIGRIRRELIWHLLQRGCAPRDIANAFRVSLSLVSAARSRQ